jgi:PAS domain S-box-containing protein
MIAGMEKSEGKAMRSEEECHISANAVANVPVEESGAASPPDSRKLLFPGLADVGAFFLLDVQGVIIECNASACRVAGFSEAEMLSRNFFDLVPGSAKEELHRRFSWLTEGGRFDIDAKIMRATGESRSLSFGFSRIDSDRILCHAIDVTEGRSVGAATRKRVLALTSPFESVEPPEFAELFDIREIQEIQDAFAIAHGVSSIIGYPDGRPITKLSNPCRLCSDFVQSSREGFSACCESDSVLGGMFRGNGPVFMPCLPAGLLNAGVPIRVGGKHIANWIIGGVRDSESDIESLAGNAARWGLDRDAYRAALGEVTVMSRDEFGRIARLLDLLARQLSDIAYQNLRQARIIAERDAATRTNRENLRILSTLMANLPGMSYRCANDSEWTMEFASDGVLELTGYPAEALVGNAVLSWNDIVHPEDRARIRDLIESAISRKEKFTMEYRLRTASGDEKWVREQGVGIREPDGEVSALEGFVADITGYRRAREDLEIRNVQLDRLTVASRELNEVLEYPAILRSLASSAMDLVSARVAEAGVFEDGELVFTERNESGRMSSIRRRSDSGTGVPGQILGTGPSCFTADTGSGTHAPPGMPGSFGSGHGACVLVMGREGKAIACFVVGGRGAGFSDKEISLLELLAASAANTLSNAAMIMDLRRTERQLRESRSQFQVLADSAPVGIFLTDSSGQTNYVNPKWCELAGISAPEAMGDGWLRAVHPEDRGELLSRWTSVLEKAGSKQSEYRFLHPDGSVAWVVGQVIPELDQDGNVARYLGTLTDITEHVESEKTINALNSDLERRVEERTGQLKTINAELEAFSYSVSHDLRAPLRAIEGFSSIIEKNYAALLDAEGLRLFGVIRRNTVKMNALIGDILALSRIGTAEIDKKSVDMEALALSAWLEILPRDCLSDFRFSVDRLPPAWGDPALLKQVWINLLSNAYKYSEPSRVHGVEVGFETAGDMVRYSVSDHGVGFDEDYAGKLFGPFQRLHGSEQFEGTGVGLALVKRIVVRHGGMVHAAGKLGEGAVFSFELPRPLEKDAGL